MYTYALTGVGKGVQCHSHMPHLQRKAHNCGPSSPQPQCLGPLQSLRQGWSPSVAYNTWQRKQGEGEEWKTRLLLPLSPCVPALGCSTGCKAWQQWMSPCSLSLHIPWGLQLQGQAVSHAGLDQGWHQHQAVPPSSTCSQSAKYTQGTDQIAEMPEARDPATAAAVPSQA